MSEEMVTYSEVLSNWFYVGWPSVVREGAEAGEVLFQRLFGGLESIMYICIDFDGTMVDHDYPKIGKPAPEAVTWVRRLQLHGARIILFTMRCDSERNGNLLQEAVDYLRDNRIHLYGVNRNPDQDEWTTSPKAYGHIYVDDAAFGCPLIHPKGFRRPCVDWKKVGPQLERQLLGGR